MVSIMSIWEKQQRLLGDSITARQNHATRFAVKSLTALERNSAAYQADAMRNGEPQPMLIVRMRPTECRVTVLPNMELFVGDYVDCFNDKWLVTEVFTDENSNRFARALLCNHLFRLQNATPEIIKRWGVVLDSNYLSQTDRQLPLETGWYRAFLPLDEYAKRIFIDKRFALGKAFNKRQEEILSVVKVVWLDSTTANLSKNDSLLKMRLELDTFNAQADNVAEMLCDYIASNVDDSNNIDNENANNNGSTLVTAQQKLSWRRQVNT